MKVLKQIGHSLTVLVPLVLVACGEHSGFEIADENPAPQATASPAESPGLSPTPPSGTPETPPPTVAPTQQPDPAPGSSPTPNPPPGTSPPPATSPAPVPTSTPSITPTPTPPPKTILEVGVNVHAHQGAKEYQLMRDMGARWVRVDFSWEIIEAIQGSWDFSVHDNLVKLCRQYGLQIYGGLSNPPGWASSNGQRNGVPDPNAWKNFVRKTVERYKTKIQHWGIGNEPNLEKFWVGSTDQYIQILLIPSYQIIKSIDKKLLVLAPDLALLGSSARIKPLDFFKRIKQVGADKYIDIIAQHNYRSDLDKFIGNLTGHYFGGVLWKDGLKQILEKSRLWGKPLWLTEFGWDASNSDENTQAKNLREALEFLATQTWIQKAFIYELVDDSRYHERWGLLRTDGQLRPGYFEVQRTIQRGFRP